MSKFKIGDKVILSENTEWQLGPEQIKCKGKVGIIIDVDSIPDVDFGDKIIPVGEAKLELYKEENMKPNPDQLRWGITSKNPHLVKAFEVELEKLGFIKSSKDSLSPRSENKLYVDAVITKNMHYLHPSDEFAPSRTIFTLPEQYVEGLSIITNSISKVLRIEDVKNGSYVKAIRDVSSSGKHREVQHIKKGEIHKIENVSIKLFVLESTPVGYGAFYPEDFELATTTEIEIYDKENSVQSKIQKILGTNEYSISVNDDKSLIIGCQTYTLKQLEGIQGLLKKDHINWINTTIGNIDQHIISQILNIIKK